MAGASLGVGKGERESARLRHEPERIGERAIALCARGYMVLFPWNPSDVVHKLALKFMSNHVDLASN